MGSCLTGHFYKAIKKVKNRKPQYSPLVISEAGGIRYLHFGSEWIQGAMRLRDPYRIELAYGRQMMAWMLFVGNPGHIVQLGLGTGALTKFSYRHFPQARVTAVELNPEVIAVCDAMFALPPRDKRLSVLEMDALDFVLDASNRHAADVMHVDLYDATAQGPVLDTPEFYGACNQCLTDDGIMTVNLFGERRSYKKNLLAIQKSFSFVLSMPKCEEGNIIVVAFKKMPDVDFKKLTETARQIKQDTGIAALKWIKELKLAIGNKA
ncbi:MAG: spermidine synthase [Betaproteobacteria bacterium]|nr:spermidine synthase [Betaproteobacteria bacterium]